MSHVCSLSTTTPAYMQIRGASVWEIRLRQEGAPADGRGGGGAPALDERRQAARKQRCAIYNGVWYHLDVMAGLAWAFQVGRRGGALSAGAAVRPRLTALPPPPPQSSTPLPPSPPPCRRRAAAPTCLCTSAAGGWRASWRAGSAAASCPWSSFMTTRPRWGAASGGAVHPLPSRRCALDFRCSGTVRRLRRLHHPRPAPAPDGCDACPRMACLSRPRRSTTW